MTDNVETLHMFYLDDCDYVVDTDLDAAWSAYYKETGVLRDDANSVAIADDAPLKVMVDDDDRPSDGGRFVTKTAGEWTKELGRGIAFSTEY